MIARIEIKLFENFDDSKFHTFSFLKDVTIGYIGLWAIVANCICVIAVSRFVDLMRGKMKLILLVLATLAAFCWIWLGLLCLRVIPFSLGKSIYFIFSDYHFNSTFALIGCKCPNATLNYR